MHALSIRGLIKTYKNGVQPLKGVDLDVDGRTVSLDAGGLQAGGGIRIAF